MYNFHTDIALVKLISDLFKGTKQKHSQKCKLCDLAYNVVT